MISVELDKFLGNMPRIKHSDISVKNSPRPQVSTAMFDDAGNFIGVYIPLQYYNETLK